MSGALSLTSSMVASPIRPTLYRSVRCAVICALVALSMAHPASSQLAKKPKDAKGPRALGLIEISPDGKARLVPIAIMVDGKFYDAGAYKASPVPLALWNDTGYEGEKTGVPQGLFTVAEAMRTGSKNWFGAGNWRPTGPEPKPVKAANKPQMGDEDERPPMLRRSISHMP